MEQLLESVAKQLAKNILENASYVMTACECKVLKPTHLKAVSMIQSGILKNKIYHIPKEYKTQGGGAAVLPSEYFGINSGRYLDINDVSGSQINLYGDTTLTRVEHPIIVGGGDSIVSSDTIEKIVKNIAKSHKIRVSTEALQMIVSSVKLNLQDLAKSPSGKKATLSSVQKKLGKQEFVHMKF